MRNSGLHRTRSGLEKAWSPDPDAASCNALESHPNHLLRPARDDGTEAPPHETQSAGEARMGRGCENVRPALFRRIAAPKTKFLTVRNLISPSGPTMLSTPSSQFGPQPLAACLWKPAVINSPL